MQIFVQRKAISKILAFELAVVQSDRVAGWSLERYDDAAI
jgi:hypothetical protein